MVVVMSAPAIAATGSISNGTVVLLAASSRSPTTIAVAAASPAPGEMPASAGSASGLRNRPCITVPPAASSAPIMMAIAMRGRRIDHSTSWSRATRRGIARRRARARRAGGSAEFPRRRPSRQPPPRSRATVSRPSTTTGDRSGYRPDKRASPGAAIVISEQPADVRLRRQALRGPAPDRAQPRDRAPPSRCAGRSRADRARPSTTKDFCAAAGVVAKAACANTVLASSRLLLALHHQHGVGPGRDHRLVGNLLVALIGVDRVDARRRA